MQLALSLFSSHGCQSNCDEFPVSPTNSRLTFSIIFRDVIETVKTHAFTNSDYPVILTIENHCCEEQQRIMAQDLVDILGDRIYREVGVNIRNVIYEIRTAFRSLFERLRTCVGKHSCFVTSLVRRQLVFLKQANIFIEKNFYQ